MTIQQILAIAGIANEVVTAGKATVDEIVTFFESKGADAQQIAAIRAQYAQDIAEEKIEAGVQDPPAPQTAG